MRTAEQLCLQLRHYSVLRSNAETWLITEYLWWIATQHWENASFEWIFCRVCKIVESWEYVKSIFSLVGQNLDFWNSVSPPCHVYEQFSSFEQPFSISSLISFLARFSISFSFSIWIWPRIPLQLASVFTNLSWCSSAIIETYVLLLKRMSKSYEVLSL